MKLMITLEAARRNAGYTLKEAAPLFHVHEQTLAAYENDSSDVPFSFVRMIPNVYHFPINNIFFGKKYDFIRTIRMEKEEVS